MDNDVAIFLDLDNIVIGANEANLTFDIELILECIKELTKGRVVLRRAYADWRQNQTMMRQLATAGFELSTAVRLSRVSKNLADMQLVIEAVETLIDGYDLQTYVLMSGDRDFMPLVQVLRRRGKTVVGVGVRHTSSRSLVSLCDHYVFYDDLVKTERIETLVDTKQWLQRAVKVSLNGRGRVRASILREQMDVVSDGAFGKSKDARRSFSKTLEQFPEIVELVREGTTLYVAAPKSKAAVKKVAVEKVVVEKSDLAQRYKSALKKQGLRVVPPKVRLHVLKDVIVYLEHAGPVSWQSITNYLFDFYAKREKPVSKSLINDVLRVAKRAKVVSTLDQGRRLSSALPLQVALKGENIFQRAVMACDRTYLSTLRSMPGLKIDINAVAVALYDSTAHRNYLEMLIKDLDKK